MTERCVCCGEIIPEGQQTCPSCKRRKGKMIDFYANKPHMVSEVICLKCHKRWIAVYPEKTLLKELECPCGAVGYVIKTGQELEEGAEDGK